MSRTTSARKAFADFGASAKEIDRDLQSFRKSAEVLSSSRRRLINKYEGQWVAVYDGDVVASEANVKGVKAALVKAGIAPESAIIRFIEKNRRTMIL